MHHFTDKELLQRRLPLGVYEHFKSTPSKPKRYRLIMLARHTETNELLAVYIPLYDDPGQPACYCRPAAMFFEGIEVNGKCVQRFRWIGP